MIDATCDMSPGTAAMDNPAPARAVQISQAHHYGLLELRARSMIGTLATEAGDTETPGGI